MSSLLESPLRQLISQAKRPFVRDAGVLQIGAFVSLGLNFLLAIGLARALGRDGYGAYALVVSIVTTISLFKRLGQDFVATTKLAAAYAKGDARAARDTLITFNVVNIWSTLLVIPVALLLADSITVWFYRDETLAEPIRLALLPPIWAMALATLVIVLQCSRRMTTLTLIENGNTLALALCSLVAVWIGGAVSGIFWGQALASLLVASLAVVAYHRLQALDPLVPPLRSLLAGIARPVAGAWGDFKSGLAVALDKNLVSLYALAPILLLGSQAPTGEVALLRVAMSLLTVPTLALSAISRLLMVKFPELQARQPDRVRHFFLSITATGGGLSIVLTIPLVLLAPWLLGVLYGSEFVSAAGLIPLVAIVPLLAGFDIAAGPIYRTYGRNIWAVYANLGVLAIGLPLALLLTHLHGIQGAAVGYAALVTTLRVVGYLLCLKIVSTAD